jgi:hypothetical protein
LGELKRGKEAHNFVEDTVVCMMGYSCFEPERETDFNIFYLTD